MAWSKHHMGWLATGSEDATVKVWDVTAVTGGSNSKQQAEPGTQIKPLLDLTGHSSTVEDLDWNGKDPHMLGTVGDDRQILLWDTRKPEAAAHKVEKAHEDDINCIAFNPTNAYLFATGSADKSVAVWDSRNLRR